MKKPSVGLAVLKIGLPLLGAAALPAILLFPQWKRSRDVGLIYKEVIVKLRAPGITKEGLLKEGYWVGDIAELYRMGQISREVAEADTAPLNPLGASPVPFHGYYVRVLETAPSMTSGNAEMVPLKGRKWSRDTFAICIYPANPGPDTYAWILWPGGELRRAGGEPPEGFAPTSWRELRNTWWMVD